MVKNHRFSAVERWLQNGWFFRSSRRWTSSMRWWPSWQLGRLDCHHFFASQGKRQKNKNTGGSNESADSRGFKILLMFQAFFLMSESFIRRKVLVDCHLPTYVSVLKAASKMEFKTGARILSFVKWWRSIVTSACSRALGVWQLGERGHVLTAPYVIIPIDGFYQDL